MHLKIILYTLTLSLFLACNSEYEQKVKQELATGVTYDTLLFDLKIGESKKEFFAKCWDLNKQQKISQGSGNKYAKFYMEPISKQDSTKKVEVLFYGMFDKKDIMYGMDMKMGFTAWAPWNKELYSDKLISYMKTKYMNDYGKNAFIEIDINEKTKAFVKVDGNRQILMFPIDDHKIAVKITDLSHKL